MSEYLTEPVLEKSTFTSRGQGMYISWSSMQNWRRADEDELSVYIIAPHDKESSFAAVYDGHGGPQVARYVNQHLHQVIQKQPSYKHGNFHRALHQGFIQMDNMVSRYLPGAIHTGTTANVALIKGTKLYVANLGDSRSIACVSGNIFQLSEDHKPDSPIEKARIVKAGYRVIHHRINGELAISRTLGDFAYKNQNMPEEERAVSCIPSVYEYEITNNWEFLFLACDGVYDVFSSEEAGRFIKQRLDEHKMPEDILEELMDRCSSRDGYLGGPGSDNVSGILIVFVDNLSLPHRIKYIRRDRPMTYERRPKSRRSSGSKPHHNKPKRRHISLINMGRDRPSYPLPCRRSERIRLRRMTN